MSEVNVSSAWVDGNLVFYDKSNNEIATWDGANRKFTLPSGSTLDVSAATLSQGTTSLSIGHIPLPLFGWRKITSDDFGAIAVASGNGGQLATDTTPILQRINAATDNKARISWVAGDVVEIQQDIVLPPDVDDTADLTVNLIVYKNGNTDTTATLAVGYWEGIGDTEVTSNTAAITETAAALKTVAVAAASVGAYPKAAAITITPNTHAADAIYLLGAWVSYTRKTN